MNLKYYLRGLGIGIVVTALLMGFALKSTKEKLTDEEIMARAEQLGMVQSSVLSEDLGKSDEIVSENHTEVVKADSTESEKIEEAEKNEDRLNPTDAGKAEEKKPETTENIDNIDNTDNTKTEAVDSGTESGKETDKKETTATDNGTEADKKDATTAGNDTESDKKDTTAADNKTETDKKSDNKETDAADSGTESEKKETDKNKDKVYTVTIRNGDDSMNVANRLQQLGVIKDAAAFDDYLCKNGYDKHLATGEHKVKAGMSEKELAKALMN